MIVKIKKLFSVFTAAILAAVTLCTGQAVFATSAGAKETADSIIEFSLHQSGAGSLQEWVDTVLTDGAGTTSEWYIVGLLQYNKNIDFSGYADALEEYLEKNEISSASSRMKYALVLYGCGRGESDFVRNAIDDSVGKQGIMSYVYGLHLFSNGLRAESITSEEVIQKIISLQLEDGGWAVSGNKSDADVTAMTLQALAPYYNDMTDVRHAADNALRLLSELQLETGCYSSYGVQNPESAAQVVTALSALGIDPFSDARFIKGNNTLFDAIMAYQLEDGSFEHTLGGGYNQNATVQVFYSMVSAYRQENGLGSLYIFDTDMQKNAAQNSPSDQEEQNINETQTAAETRENAADMSDKSDKGDFNDGTFSYKIWIYAAATAAAAIVLSVLALKKSLNKGNCIFVILITAAAVIFVHFSNFQTVSDYYSSENEEGYTQYVTLSISCESIAEQSGDERIPDGRVILPETEIGINSGDTVYDVLERAGKKFGISFDTKGAPSVYVSGISNIYEFDFGDLSGWLYFVNDESPSLSCAEYILSDGDSIEWRYTVDLGKEFE